MNECLSQPTEQFNVQNIFTASTAAACCLHLYVFKNSFQLEQFLPNEDPMLED